MTSQASVVTTRSILSREASTVKKPLKKQKSVRFADDRASLVSEDARSQRSEASAVPSDATSDALAGALLTRDEHVMATQQEAALDVAWSHFSQDSQLIVVCSTRLALTTNKMYFFSIFKFSLNKVLHCTCILQVFAHHLGNRNWSGDQEARSPR